MTTPDPLDLVNPDDFCPLEGGAGYYLYKDVNLAQLQHEMEVAAGLDYVTVCMSGEPPYWTLWVRPADYNPSLLAQVVSDHVVIQNWGVPQTLLDFNDALVKLQGDPAAELSDAEKDSLLRGLALQIAAVVAAMGNNSSSPGP